MESLHLVLRKIFIFCAQPTCLLPLPVIMVTLARRKAYAQALARGHVANKHHVCVKASYKVGESYKAVVLNNLTV